MKASPCDLVDIGARMRAAREAIGLGQTEFANKYDLTAVTYRRNENGRNEAGICLVSVFVRAGINANWLLTGEGPMLLRDVVADRAADLEGLDAISLQQVNAAYDVSIRSHTDAGDEETLVVVKEVPQPLNVGALKAMLRAAIEMVQAGATTPDRAADLAAKLYSTALESGEITPTAVGPGSHGKAA